MLAEASKLGVLQVHLSGGEPLRRRDLPNVPPRERAGPVHEPDHQRARPLGPPRPAVARRRAWITCRSAFRPTRRRFRTGSRVCPRSEKLTSARLVKQMGWPLTLNVVLHRLNIDRIGRYPRPGRRGGRRPDRAGQYAVLRLGRGTTGLSCCRAGHSSSAARWRWRAAHERLKGQMEIIYVIPDYYSRYPKPCMGGWARRQLTVVPNGDVLPCPPRTTPARCRAPACASTRWPGSG